MADLTKRNYKNKIKKNNNNSSYTNNLNNDSNICEKTETEEELRKKIEIISNQLEKAKTDSQRDNHDKTKLEEEFKKLNCKVVEYKVKIDDMRIKIDSDSNSKNNYNFDDDDSSSNDDDTSQMPVATNSLLMSCTDIRRTDDDDDDDERNGTMLPTLYDQESSGSSVFTSSGYDSVSNFDFSSIIPNQDEGIQLTHHQMDNSDYCIVNTNNNIRPDITDEQDFENIDKLHNRYSHTDDNNINIDDDFEYIQNNSNTFSPTSTNSPPKIAYNPVAYQYNKIENSTNNYPQQEYINITQPQSSMYTQQMNISPTDDDNRFDYESPITPQHQEYQRYQSHEQNISPPPSPLKKQFHSSYQESSNYDDVISYSSDVMISNVPSNNHLQYDNTDRYIKDNMHVAGSSDDDTDNFINSRSGGIPKSIKRHLQHTKYSQNNNNINIDRLQEQQEKRKSMPVDKLNFLYEKQMNQNPPRQRQAASNSIRPCNSLGSRGQFDNSASLRRDSYIAPLRLSGNFDIEKADALLNGRSSYSSASYYSENKKNQKTKPVYKRERSFTKYEISPRYAPHPDTTEQRYQLHRTDAYPTYDPGERNFSQTNTGIPPPTTTTSNSNRARVGVANSYNRSASNRSHINQNVRPLPIQPINHQYEQMQSPLDSDASDSGIGSYFGQEIIRPSTTIAYNLQDGQYLQVSAPEEPSKAEYKEIIDNLKQQVEDLTYKIISIQHTTLPESPPTLTQSNIPPPRTGPSVAANNPRIIHKPVNKVPSPNLSNNRNPQEKLSPRMSRPNLLNPSTKETYPSRAPIIYGKALSGTPSTYKTKQHSQLVIPIVTARNNHPNAPRTTNIPQPDLRHNGPRSKSSMQQPSNITSSNNNNSNNTSTSSSNSGGGVHHYPTASTMHKSTIIRPLSSQNSKKPPQIYGSRMKMPPPPM